MKQKIHIKKSITDENTKKGNEIRKRLDENGVFVVNVMASPGAGKTSLIIKTIEKLQSKYSIGVIEGDIVPIDVEKIKNLGIPVVLAHTGGSCHLDGVMMNKALRKLDLKMLDLLIIENVGNLICPASFYLGTHKNIVIASVPEGDDKPYKYPSMFREADIVILNKADYLGIESFDVANFCKGIHVHNSETSVIQTSCRTDTGIKEWIDWLDDAMRKNKLEK